MRRKLRDDQIEAMSRRYLAGESGDALGREYGITGASFRSFLRRRGVIRKASRSIPPLDVQTLAYIAGIFDGEGCVAIGVSKPSLTRKKSLKWPSYWLQVSITNTYRPLIDWLHNTVGGHVSDSSHSPSRRKCKPCWAWRMMSNEACAFLEIVLPYLRVKQQQAMLGIEFQQSLRSHCAPLTQEILKQRATTKAILSAMNTGKTIPVHAAA